MNISLDHRKAVARILLEIIVADDIVDPSELDQLEKVRNELKMKQADIDASMDMKNEAAYALIGELSADQKEVIGELLFAMVMADGIKDPSEERKLHEICAQTGILLPD